MRYAGVRELAGDADHPLIRWWLSLCGYDPASVHDETPWCAAFTSGIAWELRLPRSKSAAARSWLTVGTPISITAAQPDADVVVFWRGEQSGLSGHVGFFAGLDGGTVLVLGGNQNDGVNIGRYRADRLLGVRRLA
jgi:uncharacterized protein (TIGR02594 family)